MNTKLRNVYAGGAVVAAVVILGAAWATPRSMGAEANVPSFAKTAEGGTATRALRDAMHRAGRASPAPTKSEGSHPSQTARRMGHPAGQEARIARIENGLLAPVAIKGEPPHTKTMAAEMARLKVPGVSVAFWDHGKIAWTRTYGYADVATKRRVTPETLFQAGSISKPVAALATLRLVQEGKLNLDENVNDITFSFEKSDKPSPKITIQAGTEKFVAKRVE